MVIFEELEIQNCFSFTNVCLRFNNNNFATILNCSSAHKLIAAIQPFFCKDMVILSMEEKPDVNHTSSYVRIKFRILDDKNNDLINAKRYSSNPNTVLYWFNEDQYIEPIQLFHERFQTNVTSYYPFLKQCSLSAHKNILFQWVSSMWPQQGATKESLELYSDYLEITNRRPQTETKLILKLAEINLYIAQQCELQKKSTFVSIANETDRIFNYITYGDYNVKFFIPLFGGYLQNQVKWEDIDLNNAETHVQKTGGQCYIWSMLEPGLRNLLLISQMIALAKHIKQKIIFIEDTSILQKHQNNAMIKVAILQSEEINIESNWQRTNFLKRIIDICNESSITIMINYQGVIPFRPMNANIVKSRGLDQMYVCTNLHSMRLDDLPVLF